MDQNNAFDRACQIVRAANAAIPPAKFDLVTPFGDIPNVVAFGRGADRVRAAGNGKNIVMTGSSGSRIVGRVENLRPEKK